MLRTDMKRAILNRHFVLLCFVAIILFWFPMFINLFQARIGFSVWFHDISALQAWVRMRDTLPNILFNILSPLLCCIPYALSYRIDLQNNAVIPIAFRTKRGIYSISRLISNGLAGGLILIIPQLFTILVCLAFAGQRDPVDDSNLFQGIFYEFYPSSPIVYFILRIVFNFLFGMSYATFALASSLWIKQRILILVSPLLFMLIVTLLFEAIELSAWSPNYTIVNQFMSANQDVICLIEFGVISFVSAIVFFKLTSGASVYDSK